MPPKKKKGKAKGKTVAETQERQQPQAATPRAPEVPPRAPEFPLHSPGHASGSEQGAGDKRPSAVPEKRREPQVAPKGHESSASAPCHVLQTELGAAGGDKRASVIPKKHREPEAAASKKVQATPETLGIQLTQSLTFQTPFTKRPDYGSRGRKIGLIVNYFPVELPSGYVYHYDVEISLKRRDSPESALETPQLDGNKFRCFNTKKNREVISVVRMRDEFRDHIPAFDGRKNLYTRTRLKAAPFTVVVEMPPVATDPRLLEDPLPRGDMYEVTIKPVYKTETNTNVISLDSLHALYEGKVSEVPREAIMAVETILRTGPCSKYVPLGRSFFCPPERREDMHPLSGGKEIWFGHHQSLILAEWKPVININVTATTFRMSGPVINYVSEILECSVDQLRNILRLRDADIVMLSKKMKGVKVFVTHLPYQREYRVLRLTREAASRLEFTVTINGAAVRRNVSEYFRERYNVDLYYSHLPCIQAHPEQKRIFLPLEVCKIIQGQHSNERMTESQTSEMIKVASLPPDKRFRNIQDVLRRVKFNEDQYNKAFGIKVSPNPMNVEGRVIDPPNITYSNDKRIMPKDGSWEMKTAQFYRGAEVGSWVILSFVNERFCSRDDLQKFAQLLSRTGQDCGIRFGRLVYTDIFMGRQVKVGDILQRVRGKYSDVKFAIVVLQGKSSPLYGEIKQVSESVLGLVTQCVQDRNIKRLNASVMNNICQKINSKMGGVNNSLTPGEKPAIFSKPVIIIGADVTHPPPGSFRRPSIAAAVASLDAHPSRYALTLRAQKHHDDKKMSIEIIEKLEDMVFELLKAFRENTNGKVPEKIIFYRDGVSDGQFVEVRNKELRAIQNACMKLGSNYKPGITFIVVQKRHHTRFIPRDLGDGIGPKRNVPPGTVVDRGASSRMYFDFFLCSHFGLQGTSRPAHYTVLCDHNKFTSDELQKLTYYLCHIYARCTRSVSIPAPVAYADLAAYRAAKYLSFLLDESSDSSDVSAAELLALQKTWAEMITFKPELKNTLFYV